MMNEKRWLALIVTLFVILGITYAIVTPVFEASDELWHYPMVRHLADGNPLPVQVFDPAQAGPWKQEASQPPLYYYLSAGLTFWIDTSDMAQVRLENPHVDNGLITPDGNINLVMHDPDAKPWQGTLLAVRIVRLFSVLLGAMTVTLTYLIGREVAPGRPEIALGSAAVTAFLPMFLFISGAVNNDNLAIMMASLALLLMIRIVKRNKQSDRDNSPMGKSNRQLWREAGNWLLLGAVIGLALLTKEGTIGLIPLAWGTAFIVAWQRDKQRYGKREAGFLNTLRWLAGLFVRSLLNFAFTMLLIVLISGWWYYRNIQLYGDWLGWNAFIAVLGQRGHSASLAQLWGERRGFLMAYWGLFGGVNVPMPTWIYTVLNTLLFLSVTGFLLYLLRLLQRWIIRVKGTWRSFSSLINNPLNFVTTNFGLVFCLLFTGAVVFGLIRWATTTWSSQGRLVFTALSALSILFMVGLVGWLPQRPARWITGLIATFLFIIAALAPILWIAPAYQPDSYSPPRPYALQGKDITFGDTMRLRGIAVETPEPGRSTAKPGDSLWIHLDWELLQPVDRNWSAFVHLIDPILEQPIAQRDMFLGQGLMLTSWMEPGQRIVNSYQLQIPHTVVSPSQLKIAAGLYDFETGERLPTSAENDLAFLTILQIEPESDDLPNPISINLEDELELTGFDFEPRRALPGDTVNLTLYWQARQPLDNDYTFFAQIVGEDNTRWASHDFAPPEGTSSWTSGEVQPMALTLTLDENSVPGLYPVIVGAYTRNSGGDFDRLQILTADGRLTDDFLELTRVRID
jgi:4-amino-4-deoxy-L-arabinose transferase-like glycosyltransferase